MKPERAEIFTLPWNLYSRTCATWFLDWDFLFTGAFKHTMYHMICPYNIKKKKKSHFHSGEIIVNSINLRNTFLIFPPIALFKYMLRN